MSNDARRTMPWHKEEMAVYQGMHCPYSVVIPDDKDAAPQITVHLPGGKKIKTDVFGAAIMGVTLPKTLKTEIFT